MPDPIADAPASVSPKLHVINLLPVPLRPDLDSATQVSLWERIELASEFSAYDPDAPHPGWVRQALRFPHSREWPTITFVGVNEPQPVDQLDLLGGGPVAMRRSQLSIVQDRPAPRVATTQMALAI